MRANCYKPELCMHVKQKQNKKKEKKPKRFYSMLMQRYSNKHCFHFVPLTP